MNIITPVLLPAGYIDWVHPWRVGGRRLEGSQPVYLYGEEFNSPYCPVQFEGA